MTGSDTLAVDENGLFQTSATTVTINGNSVHPVITNSGTIRSTGGRAIRVNDSGAGAHSLTLTNESTGLIESTGDDAVQISTALNGGTVVLDNYGTINSTASRAVNFNAATGGTITINNYASGVISANVGADVLRPGANATITNYGTIQSNANDTTFNGDGIDFQANAGGSVENFGLIEGSKHGITGDNGATVVNEEDGVIRGRNGSGINYDTSGSAPAVSITNYGLISGEAQVGTSTDTDGDGVDVDGLVAIENYGTIQALGAIGNKDGVVGDPNISDGVSVGGGSINNYAGAVISSVGRGILSDDSEGGAAFGVTSIYNEGTITSGAGWATITLRGDWNDTLINKGTISGDVLMGGGADIVTLYTGQSIGGTLDGGDGSDTLTLTSATNGSAGISNVANFEWLDVAAGSWSLDDDQSYSSGATIRSAATLTVDHDLAAITTIEGGGKLQGSGTIDGLVTTGSGAIVSPGRDGELGVLTVDGNVSLSGATLAIDMDTAGAMDRIDASGTVQIDGGKVVLNASAGAYTVGTTTTILSAAGGASGLGDTTVESPFLFIAPVVGIEANAVTLTLDRNDIAFASLARTSNQRGVANAIEAAAVNDDLYRWTAGATDAASVTRSYDSLSGEIHADVAGTLTQGAMQAELAILSRLSRLDNARPQQTASADGASAALAYGEASHPKASPAFDALTPSRSAYSGWTQAFGNWTSTDGDGNAASADSSVGGALVGADLSGENYTLGIAGGYSWGSLDVDDRQSSADINTGLLALYGGTSFDKVKLRGGASIGWSSIDSTRTATVGNITERPEASYDATTTNVFAELAYAATLSGVDLEPYAAIGWSNVDTDSFTETNAPVTGLTSEGQSYDTPYSTLGLRVASTLAMGGVSVTPRGMVGWRHAFDDVAPEAAMAFSSTGTGFTVEGVPIAQDSLLLEAGADVALNRNVTLGLTYVGALSSEANSNSVKATGEIKF
jgi:outer membrane autotransporter protein